MKSLKVKFNRPFQRQRIRVLIATDTAEIMIRLSDLIGNRSSMQIATIINNGFDLLKLIPLSLPNVIIADTMLPDIEESGAAKGIYDHLPGVVGVIAFSEDEDKLMLTELLMKGYNGILLNAAHDREIIQAIVAVASGHKFFCSRACEILNSETQ